MHLQKSIEMVSLLTMYELNNIHQRIKKLREDLKLSKGELARRIGVSRAAVSQWEKEGKGSTSPDGENLFRCAVELKSSPGYLLHGKSESAVNDDHPSLIQLEYTVLPVLNDNDIIELSKSGRLHSNYQRTVMIMEHHLKTSPSMFGYEIINDAMVNASNPDSSLHIGETAIIDKDMPPKSGDIVLTLLESDVIKLRQLMIDGKDYWLKAFNSNYTQAKLDPTKDKFMGTFIGVQPKMRLVRNT